MPGFYIQSLFERQLEKLRQRHAKVRLEIDAFIGVAEMFDGKEVGKVFRDYVEVPWGWRYRGERLPEIPFKALPYLDEFLQLNRREAALVRRMRNSAFWWHRLADRALRALGILLVLGQHRHAEGR